jgi:hypothetical protein
MQSKEGSRERNHVSLAQKVYPEDANAAAVAGGRYVAQGACSSTPFVRKWSIPAGTLEQPPKNYRMIGFAEKMAEREK